MLVAICTLCLPVHEKMASTNVGDLAQAGKGQTGHCRFVLTIIFIIFSVVKINWEYKFINLLF